MLFKEPVVLLVFLMGLAILFLWFERNHLKRRLQASGQRNATLIKKLSQLESRVTRTPPPFVNLDG